MATDTTVGHRRNAVFYGLRTERPYDCRLEHVRFALDPSPGQPDAYQAIADAMKRRFSRNEFSDVQPAHLPTLALGSDMMRDNKGAPQPLTDVRYWMAPTRLIVLARAGSTVQLMSQTYIVAAALKAETELSPNTDWYGHSPLTWDIVNALRPMDSEAVEVILSHEGIVDQPLVERTALRVLRARAAAADNDYRAMLSLAATHIVSRLTHQGDSWERDRPALKSLLPLGVHMERSPYDAYVWYGSVPFGEEVRLRRPHTRWGQLAFLDKLSAGWTDSLSGDQYRHVITQGTSWLKRHPNSPFAVTVMSLVGRAYETWWSLSLAPDDEELVTAAEHKEGALEARLHAIRWYERILREYPNSIESRHARRVIVQITLGVDTGERVFYAVYA